MALNALWYSSRQTLISLARNFWLAVAAAAMIAVSLTILGAFLLVAVNAGQLMKNIESTVEINVFLHEDADVRGIRNKLGGLSGIEEFIFVSKHQGLREFEQSLGDSSLLSGLDGDNNPLPDSFRVRAGHADLVPVLARQIAEYPGVKKVRYGEEWLGTLVKVTKWVNIISLGVGALLAAAAVFLIVTTIRLSVVAREEEVGIMKYLGASNWFVRCPFILEGMLVGFTGALVALVGLGLAYYYLVDWLQRETLIYFWYPVTDTQVLMPLLGGLLVLGLLMGGIGSVISLRKFLRV